MPRGFLALSVIPSTPSCSIRASSIALRVAGVAATALTTTPACRQRIGNASRHLRVKLGAGSDWLASRTESADQGIGSVASAFAMGPMGALPFAGLGLAVAALYCLKEALSWFQQLDADSTGKMLQTMEDPSLLKPVSCPSLFAEPSKSLSVVIPAYNEEKRLPATLEEALAYLDTRRRRKGPYFTYEILVVDDGSSDRTCHTVFNYIRKYGFDTIRLLRLPKNRGKGCAVKQGMLCARGCSILMMDADGATKVADLDKLDEELAALTSKKSPTGAAVVFGSRHHLQSKAQAKRSWHRNILMHGFHLLVLIVAGPACPKDTQCGFKLFNRKAAQVLVPNQRLQRWCFDVELTWLAHQLGVPISEVGVNWTEIPGSKICITSIVHMAFELVGVELAYKWLGLWTVRTEAEIAKTMN